MKQTHIYLSWLVASVATAGSLYFSNIMNYPPCSLCWWQRIFMYPLAILFAVAFIKRDPRVSWYSTPLIIFGWVFAVYHNLIYYKILDKPIVPCSSGVSCSSVQVELLGFITIPLMSLTAFTILGIIHIIHFAQSSRTKQS